MEYYWPQKSVVVCTQRLDIWGHKNKAEDNKVRFSNPFTKAFMILTSNKGIPDKKEI